MFHKVKEVLSGETAKVFGVAIAGTGVSMTDIEHALRIIVLVGTAIYVWRRAFKKPGDKDNVDID